MTVHYVAAARTMEEIEAWCAARGLRPCGLERGPDGMIRGLAVPVGTETPDAKETT